MQIMIKGAGKKFDIDLSQVLSARGTLIVGDISYLCYCLYLKGFEKKAREILIQEHFRVYFGDTRNITTDKIVAEIYKNRGIKKPLEYKDSNPGIVLTAVEKRVDEYLDQLRDFKENGYKETTEIKMSPKGDWFQMRSCGENKVAALAALKHKIIPNVTII